ncbi:hypothetical protein CAP36_11750 [Chitinophagaceae bacterium IBVUCB2]|nr:hypothetical protein CAP36_11750 [Chitinophagaceae bacterium IBVUCB2]
MKQLLTIILVVFSTLLFSQEKVSFLTPPPSPEASFTQQLVNGEITVTYSRPLARGRKIFGGLVPFDSIWRTGASGATTILLSEEIIMGNKTLKAGKFALFTIPGEKEWTIIINADTALHGAFGYDSKKDVHRFKVQPVKSEKFQEAFTIDLNEIAKNGDGFLSLSWENTLVKIPLKSPVDEKVMTEINARLINSSEKNAELFYQAANYYYATGRDLKQAAVWATEAEKADKENFYYPNLLQKILADQKDYKAATAAARRAIVLGEKKNMTTAVTALKKRIAEWENK